MNAGLGHCLAEEAATARLRAGWGGRKATLRVAKGPWHELGRGGQKYGEEADSSLVLRLSITYGSCSEISWRPPWGLWQGTCLALQL